MMNKEVRPQLFGKEAVRKPNVYIASNYGELDRDSSLDIAEEVVQSPFVENIFLAEGLYPLNRLQSLPNTLAEALSFNVANEMSLADIFIIDRRYGDPVELGYAIAKGVPYIEFNPDKKLPNPCFTGGAVLSVTDIEEFADINYLKI